jgi:hypothetical protein
MVQVKEVTVERECVIKSLPAYFGEISEKQIIVIDVSICANSFVCHMEWRFH